MKRAFIVVAIVVALLVAGAGIATWRVLATVDNKRTEIEAAVASDFLAFAPALLADQALASHWLLAVGRERDAGPLLNAAFAWRNDTPEAKAWTAAHPPRFTVPVDATSALRLWGTDWPKHADDVVVKSADLSWMNELRTFDHWDLERNGPNEGTTTNWAETPMPDFRVMQDAAKLRMLQRIDGDVEASADVRALARLVVSTETLIGAMIGVTIVGIERAAFHEAVARGIDVTDWSTDTVETRDRLKRALLAAPGAFSLLTPPAFYADAIVVGRCAGLQESLGHALFLKNLLQPKYSERYAALTRALERSTCRLTRLRRQWPIAQGAVPRDERLFCLAAGTDALAACNVPRTLAHVPFVAAAVGEILLAIAVPDSFKLYREPPATP